MPTYEYACTACGHRLEAVQSFSDDPLTECPECGAPLRKVYGNVGIVLKGSGFYKTDSRAASARAPTAREARSQRRPPATRRARTRRPRRRPRRPASNGSGAETPSRPPPPPAEGQAHDSVAAERHVGDGQGLARRHAGEPAQVAADLDDRLQHALQRGGDGHLPHRLRQRAASGSSAPLPPRRSRRSRGSRPNGRR